MANYIQTLKEENEQLKKQLEEKKAVVNQYDGLSEEEDGRNQEVEIVLRTTNPMSQFKFVTERLPLQQAFDRLINFYSSFSKSTDRNVPKDYWNGQNAVPCNQAVCYVKKTFMDKVSGQKIENIRKEVPLWLAVDDSVQKGQTVELISKKEYDDFFRTHVKNEIKQERVFQDKMRQRFYIT